MLVRIKDGAIDSSNGKKCTECGEWNKKESDVCWNCHDDIRKA